MMRSPLSHPDEQGAADLPPPHNQRGGYQPNEQRGHPQCDKPPTQAQGLHIDANSQAAAEHAEGAIEAHIPHLDSALFRIIDISHKSCHHEAL